MPSDPDGAGLPRTGPDPDRGARFRGRGRPRGGDRRGVPVPERRRVHLRSRPRRHLRPVEPGPTAEVCDRRTPRAHHDGRTRVAPEGPCGHPRSRYVVGACPPARQVDARVPLGRREHPRQRGEWHRRLARCAPRVGRQDGLRGGRDPPQRGGDRDPDAEPGRPSPPHPSQRLRVRPQPGSPVADAAGERFQGRAPAAVSAAAAARSSRVRLLRRLLPAERRSGVPRDHGRDAAPHQRHLWTRDRA